MPSADPSQVPPKIGAIRRVHRSQDPSSRMGTRTDDRPSVRSLARLGTQYLVGLTHSFLRGVVDKCAGVSRLKGEGEESLVAFKHCVVRLMEADEPLLDAVAVLVHAYASGAVSWPDFIARAEQLIHSRR